MPLSYKIVTVTSFMQNCSIIWCNETKEAAIVDPGGDANVIIENVNALNVKITKILLTHGHLDHVGASETVAEHFKTPIIGPEIEDKFWLENLPSQSQMFDFPNTSAFEPAQWLTDGEEITLGKERLQVIHIPGHTPGHVVFYNQTSKIVWVGDVLFNGGIGRTDFPRGDFNTLISGIKNKLLTLGNDITFIPGHGPSSTIGYERRTNPFIADEMPI